MPELPEVETVRSTLEHLILNKEIIGIDVYYDRILINQSVDSFKKNLLHKKFTKLDRYGKYLIFYLDDLRLLIHLRMEGKFYIKDQTAMKDKHEHIIFTFSDGETLRYHDTRKFGTMELLFPGEKSITGLTKIGLEPFEEGFTVSYLYPRIHASSRPIKGIILDQSIIAGLGNIYADEVLFRSGLHPSKKGNKVTKKETERIIESCKSVLNKAIDLGGSTIRSYTSSLGVTGRFQNELMIHMREGEKCNVCGETIIKTRVAGRGTYLCPHCQRK